MQHIVFHLGKSEYGIPVTEIREVLKVGALHSLPDVPEDVMGVMAVRKGSLVVIDFKKRLRIEAPSGAAADQRVIVVKNGESMLGLFVDQVSGIVSVDEKSIDASAKNKTLTGIAREGERLILLVDLREALPSVAARR